MAVLSSPLFNAQQRLDLEDLNQLTSGLRTDSKLFIRQFFNTENMIVKGFQCDASIDQNELQVDIISAGSTESATFILAGREFDQTTGAIIESPSDFSWFTIESSQVNTLSGPAIRMTAEIPTTFRPVRGTTRLYAYVRLLNSQGTPITKAFWDPSANSGAGAEFNQSVNTANDLAISIEVVNAPITDTTELLGRIPLCVLSVDAGGQIRSVVDTRELFFKKEADFAFSTLSKLNLISTDSLTNSEVDGLNANLVNAFDFRDGEEVIFVDLNATTPTAALTQDIPIAESVYAAVNGGIRVRGIIQGVPTGTSTATTIQIDDLRDAARALIDSNAGWAETVKSRSSIVVGLESGATRMVETLTNRFDIDDKNITSLYKVFQSLETEIRRIKGTTYWYDDPVGTLQDVLRHINSTIIGEAPNARYIWNPDNLTITTIPFRSGSFVVAQQPSTVTPDTFTVLTNASPTGNVIITASATLNTGTNFQVGTDTAETARNMAAAITRTKAALLTTVSGSTVTVSVTFANVAELASFQTTNTTAFNPLNQPTTDANTDLAALRFYGIRSKFILTRHDASTTVTSIPIPERHLAYIKLPDFDDPTFDPRSTQTYRYTGVISLTDNTTGINAGDIDDDAVNVPQSSNSFIGRIIVVPIERFEEDARNFWIAFHEDGVDNANNLFVRDIGQIGPLEEVPIGEGVSDQTLSYIGAPNESTSTPNYPSVATINAFAEDGVFVTSSTRANVNANIITEGENLTNSISDLNLVTVSLKDATAQDKDMKIIGGGVLDWTVASPTTTGLGTLTFPETAFLQVPGLVNTRNTLPASIIFPASGSSADQVASATVNRSGTTTATLTITVVDTNAFTPSRDTIVIARRFGEDLYVGVNGSMRYSAGEAAPLDGALSLFGFQNGQIPFQLRLAADPSITGGIGTSVADAEIDFNINASGGVQKLNLSILNAAGATTILRFPGADIDFTNGKILDSGLTRNYLGRADGADGTEFAVASGLAGTANSEVWYAISLDADNTIEAANTDPGGGTPNAGQIRTEDVGKTLTRLNISFGDVALITAGAESASFTGTTPIGQVKIQTDGSGNLIAVQSANVIQLGASGGGGGGGAGDASTALEGFINRLNFSTFNYFTPSIASIFATQGQVDFTNSPNLVAGNTGFQMAAGQVLQTNQLLDREYLQEGIDGIAVVELEGTWTVSSDGTTTTQTIDPNAIWEIRKASSGNQSTFVPASDAISSTIVGYIDDLGALLGVNLSGITPSVANNNILFSENHGLYTGQRVTFSSLGNILIIDPDTSANTVSTTTGFYVNRVDSSAFTLHSTRALAEVANNKQSITANGAPVSVTTLLPAGVLPRVGETNVVRGIYNFPSTPVVAAADLNIQIRITASTAQQERTQETTGLLNGFALFYDQDGADIDSIPSTLDNAHEIFRSNHLQNTVTSNAGYGVAGRGVVLLNNASTPVNTELAFDANNKITRDNNVALNDNVINDIGDVSISSLATNQSLQYNGTNWVNSDNETLYQEKTSVITANQTGDIITFNNLTVGATYRATAYFNLVDVDGGGEDAGFRFFNGTTGVSTRMAVANPGESNARMMTIPQIFVAANAARTLRANLDTNTYSSSSTMVVILEELPTHTVTTQWT